MSGEVVAHNHVSFDIKAVGECPACDQYGRVNWLYPSARPAAPVVQGADGLRCYCERDRAGHEWSLDEGCTRRPRTDPGNPLAEAIAREVSAWEVFVDTDGDRSIRQRESRSAAEIADALLALPALRDVLAERDRLRATVQRRDRVISLTAEWLLRLERLAVGSSPLAREVRKQAQALRQALDAS